MSWLNSLSFISDAVLNKELFQSNLPVLESVKIWYETSRLSPYIEDSLMANLYPSPTFWTARASDLNEPVLQDFSTSKEMKPLSVPVIENILSPSWINNDPSGVFFSRAPFVSVETSKLDVELIVVMEPSLSRSRE